MTVALIDYGAGNLHSVHNALRAAGAADVVITGDPAVVAGAERVVLPGVGAFAACMEALTAIDGMVEAMHAAAFDRGRPFLGVCVGMQLLADAGVEHGMTRGLGWIGGRVESIRPGEPANRVPNVPVVRVPHVPVVRVPHVPVVRVPHMGWNAVDVARPGLVEAGEAYFLHGYHFVAADAADVVATTDHGGPLVAAVARGTVLGTQFHPEKSQAYGLAFLSRFLAWAP